MAFRTLGKRNVHKENTLSHLSLVGPQTLGVACTTAAFVGMVFTLQFAREFARLGLKRAVGGVLSLAMARELAPVITCVVIAGRVGSAFAAELGAMQVSEQADVLRVLGVDPVDFLVTPRVVACTLCAPLLTAFSFASSIAAGSLLAQARHGIPASMLLDSAAKALVAHDVLGMLCKASVFGFLLSVISCSWGFTTTEGAKGVGESTTAAVVISLVAIFLSDFALTLLLFSGPGSAALM